MAVVAKIGHDWANIVVVGLKLCEYSNGTADIMADGF